MENQELNNQDKTARAHTGLASKSNLPGHNQHKDLSEKTESKAHNTGDEHIRIDEEGTEIDPDDQA